MFLILNRPVFSDFQSAITSLCVYLCKYSEIDVNEQEKTQKTSRKYQKQSLRTHGEILFQLVVFIKMPHSLGKHALRNARLTAHAQTVVVDGLSRIV